MLSRSLHHITTRMTVGALLLVAVSASTPAPAQEPSVGRQPAGSLTGKIVYLHGGHGYTVDTTRAGAWGTQRPLLLGMCEDLGNKDQMDLMAEYLYRAGATVVPLRPVGHQPAEVVLDNVDPEVSFNGDWVVSDSDVYFGPVDAVPYRWAVTSPTETAVASYRPRIPQEGLYPVYAWVHSGANRAADQLYRVVHSGGATEVTINHRRVGDGPVYLGSFHFEEGMSGGVDISNRSSEANRVVVADMIRFGNGSGDIDRGGGISGLKREDEAGLYWVEWHVSRSQGIDQTVYRESGDDDRTATVSLAPRFAAFMNRDTEGPTTDRVFVSFHSNASGGAARGVLGLFNGNGRESATTPTQEVLARLLAREVNIDMVALAGLFEHDWHDRGDDLTLDRTDIEFGEINNEYIIDEFDATIVETGFHDNRQDAAMLRDPRVRDALARATHQGLVKYFDKVEGASTPRVLPPSSVSDLSATSTRGDGVVVRWRLPSPMTGEGAPTGFRVYSSNNGYGFDQGILVDGAAESRECVMPSPPAGSAVYYCVAAVNDGGESPRSEVVGCRPVSGADKLLVVTGFDQLDRHLNPTEPHLEGGDVERVRPRDSNSFDSAVPLVAAVGQATDRFSIDTATNEAVAAGAVDLRDYEWVVWSTGNEALANRPLSRGAIEHLDAYMANGGHLLLSGSNVAEDLAATPEGRSFLSSRLGCEHAKNDAESEEALGISGSPFNGINLQLGTEGAYAARSPDVLRPVAPANAVLQYASGGAAAVLHKHPAAGGTALLLAFPLEATNTSVFLERLFTMPPLAAD